MDDREPSIEKRLSQLSVEIPTDAHERAVWDAAQAETAGRRRRRGLARGVGGLLAAALLAVSPPGQAIADAVGDLVSVGEESSVTEPNLRDPRLEKQQERVGPAVVTATGINPAGGEPYEIVAWAARNKFSFNVPEGALLSCLGTVYPQVGRQFTGKWCRDQDRIPGAIHVFGIGQAQSPGEPEPAPDAPYSAVGVTRADVAEVVIRYDDVEAGPQEVEATLGRIDDEIMDLTGAVHEFGFFEAFLPFDGATERSEFQGSILDSSHLASATAVALDSDGEVVGQSDIGQSYEGFARSALRADELRRESNRMRREAKADRG